MLKALKVQYQVTSHLNRFTTVSKKKKIKIYAAQTVNR